jgi:hypothetical protein
MKVKTGKLLAIVVGVLCSLTATIALAGEWSVKTSIARIVVRDDQAVLVYRDGGKWKNSDLCDKDSYIVLLPSGAKGGNPAFREVYASLLGAHLANRKIKAFLAGCSKNGGRTYPRLTRITVY